MIKKKILILKNEISEYNVPVYNLIGEHYDLTVGYYLKDKSKENCNFKRIQLNIRHVGPIIFVKGLKKIANEFDLVSIVPDIHVVSYCLLPFMHRNFHVVSWSIGFRVSYRHPYITSRKHIFLDKIFQSILSNCDASIFYMEKSKEFWKETDLDMNKVFVAPNTTAVLPINIEEKKKNKFLFIGTLYKGKGLDLLLTAYKKSVESGINNELIIVGDGIEKQTIEKFIYNNQLNNKIKLLGAIYDEKVLAELFSKALLCISPTQAGLSVPKSMGYGVPFVTKTTSITGGEIYHITPKKNGIMFEQDEELVQILLDANHNPQKYIEMGKKAKEYYDNNATVEHMANGAMAAFQYALER